MNKGTRKCEGCGKQKMIHKLFFCHGALMCDDCERRENADDRQPVERVEKEESK